MRDYTILVNKTHKLSINYVPNDLIVVPNEYQFRRPLKISKIVYDHFLKLQALVETETKSKIKLAINGGYRSYLLQAALWYKYSLKYGRNIASQTVAKPGTSEHQTGLAIDLAKRENGNKISLTPDDYAIVAKLAPQYNFILRYPEGKEEITGYSYEPWHYRFLPDDIMGDFQVKNPPTLEEYYQKIKKR